MFIDIKDAVKKYGKGDSTVYALDHANVEIEEGNIYVILGPSGSGKSTLLNMIGGLDSLDEGSIEVDGTMISQLNKKQLVEYRRSKVGFVFQFYNLIQDLSVQENIEVVSEISENPLDIEEVMKALEIDQYRARFPKELSGGQQQRVAIARALIKNPKLLLCDELTGALDTKSSRSVLNYIDIINQKFKTTIIIITHNNAIADMADDVIRIRDGKIESKIHNEHRIPANELEL